MNQDILKGIQRIEIDHFDPDPRRLGGACILRDQELAEAIGDLADWPAAWNNDPSSQPFNDHVLGLGEQLFDRYSWDVVPHFVLATEMDGQHSALHTDWEGVTFADPSTFTLWTPQSHFEEPHLMLIHAEFWPPPHCEFLLDKTGIYARTMFHEGVYRRYSSYERLRVVEIKLKKGEVLAFNGTIAHCTHPDTPHGRRAVNLRCPTNWGTRSEPRVRVNTTSPYGRCLLKNMRSVRINHVLREVNARDTPKGYFELGPAIRHVKRKASLRRFTRKVREWARHPARILRSSDR